ncbi:MAG: hypothetical protein ACKOW3_07015 [Hyphomicrobium sp.]
MNVHPYSFSDLSEKALNTEACAKKLEGHYGIYAASIAEFISHLFNHNGEVALTQYWSEIASLVRFREDERYREFVAQYY